MHILTELLLQEAKVFKELVLTETSKGLVHVFFAQRMTSKVHHVNQGLQDFNNL
jgi:enoyl-CoA hydratase/3-hydroxyacyl-CoA dehydrogenase